MRKGSLCSGFGGLDLALPGDLVWTSEADEAASRVLKREHPDVPNLGDLTVYPWSSADHVDVLTAGFPCQPVSAAGRQKAHDDHRWLWPDVLRIIGAVRPSEVFLENVQNIASILKGAVLAEILAGLRNAGYAARWTILGACAVGAPHHRHRWFMRAQHVGDGAPEAVRLMNGCGAPRSGGRVLLPTPQARDGDPNRRGEGSAEYWRKRRDDLGRTQGMPLGAAVCLLPTPTVVGYAPEVYWGKFAEAVALWEQITGIPAPEPTEFAPKGGRRLNPALSEWMMGLRPGMLTADMGRCDALRLAGNGVVPQQGAAAWKILAP